MPGHRRLPTLTLAPAEALARGPAVLEHVADEAVSFWTLTSEPALILGRSARDPALDRGVLGDLPVHRRASGGGAVLWNDDLISLDVVLPRDHPLCADDVVAAYRWLGEAARDGLNDLGHRCTLIAPEAARAAPAPTHPAVAAACFGTLSPWEVVDDLRKAAGLCQVRRRGGALFQLGIARGHDSSLLIGALGGSAGAEAEYAERTSDVAPLSAMDVREAVQQRVNLALGDGREDDHSPEEHATMNLLAEERFGRVPPPAP